MDTIGYSHLAAVYEKSESIEFVPIQINWQFLPWRKFSSAAAIRLLSVVLSIGVLTVAEQVLAVETVGSRGTNVANIQRCLKQLGFLNAPVTGRFAGMTKRAVIGFQRANRLTPDGAVGVGTQRALQRACQANVNPGNVDSGLRLGSKGAAVTRLQRNLKRLGYFNSANTGYYGTETQQAVIRFQRAVGIKADGIVGSRTAQAIANIANTNSVGGEDPMLSEGSKGQPVTLLQQRLRQLGYFNIPPTGNFQRITKNAVIAFQRQAGIKATGVVNQQTWDALDRYTQTPGKPKLSRQQLQDLQQRLRDLGYFNGTPTGTINSSTRQAILKFQQDYGLNTDGIPDVQILGSVRRIWKLTYANQPNQDFLFVGDRSENVRLVQQRLWELGFFDGSIDGYFDEYTRASVARFQQAYQITNPTGRVDRQTWQALNLNNVPLRVENISTPGRFSNNRYLVIVPLKNSNILTQVRRYIPDAFADQSNSGRYVNAGAFSDRNLAELRSKMLRSNGFDARVQYF